VTTNKNQKTWLEAEKEAGKLGRIGAADIIVDGSLLSLPGDEALEVLSKMGDDDLAAALSDAEAQADGDPGVDPIEPSGDSSSSPSENPSSASSEPTAEAGSTPSDPAPPSESSTSSPDAGATAEAGPAADAEAEAGPVEPETS